MIEALTLGVGKAYYIGMIAALVVVIIIYFVVRGRQQG